jgi:hypothetical protein
MVAMRLQAMAMGSLVVPRVHLRLLVAAPMAVAMVVLLLVLYFSIGSSTVMMVPVAAGSQEGLELVAPSLRR